MGNTPRLGLAAQPFEALNHCCKFTGEQRRNVARLQGFKQNPSWHERAIGYAKYRSRSDNAVIRVYDEAGNVIETHEHKREFKEW